MQRVSTDSVSKVVKASLSKMGVAEENIDIILDSILYADRRGISTHGIGRLPLYIRNLESGTMDYNCFIEIVSDRQAMTILDANNGFGQVAAYKAMEIGIEKAREYGISFTGVRNSNNFGTAGYFANIAAHNELASIIMSNAAPAIAAPGGDKAILGTNPICMACPGNDDMPAIIFDMATTVAARGKIRFAAKNKEKIPMDWALDDKGIPTDDPYRALEGTLQAIGGYKGYGLSLFVDIFAGLMTGSAFAGNVKPLSDMDNHSRNGHMFILFDIERIVDRYNYYKYLEDLKSNIKKTGDDVLLPGERSFAEEQRNNDLIALSAGQIEEINNLTERLGLEEKLFVVTDSVCEREGK